MAEKIKMDVIKKAFLEAGLHPLFQSYTRNNIPLLFQCGCGRVDSIKWVHFIVAKDKRCWFCKHNIKGNLFEKTEKLLTLLEEKGLKSEIPFKFPPGDSSFPVYCSCGEKFQTKVRYLWEMSEAEKAKCKKCHSLKLATPFGEVKKEFYQKGAKPLFELQDYKNRMSLLKFQCVCGAQDYISAHNLRHNITLVCEVCREKKKYVSLKEAQERFIKKGFKPLFNKEVRRDEKVPFLCPTCNKKRSTSLESMSSNRLFLNRKCKECHLRDKRVPYDKVVEEFSKKRLKVLTSETEYFGKNTKLRVLCLCGKETIRTYANTVLVNCSGLCKECQEKITRPRGKKHGRYSEFSDRERREYEHYLWARQIRKRFQGKCAISGEEHNLIVHHLESKSSSKISSLSITNGILLKKKLHTQFHSEYGFGYNNTQQFEEWVKKHNYSFVVFPIKEFLVCNQVFFADLKNILHQLRISLRKEEAQYILEKDKKMLKIHRNKKEIRDLRIIFSDQGERNGYIQMLVNFFNA